MSGRRFAGRLFPENTAKAAVGMYLSGPYVAGDTYTEFPGVGTLLAVRRPAASTPMPTTPAAPPTCC
ncbi:MAG: hypothetical protein R2838_24755 [Caldilineaceae bacterium]